MNHPLRIMHVLSVPAAGGAEVFVRDLSVAMAALGHKIYVLFLEKAQDAGRDLVFQEEFLSELSAAGVEYGFIGAKARRNPFLGWIRLNHAVKWWRPHVLHCHLTFGVLFSLFCGLPVVYTHHSYVLRMPRWVYRFFFDRIVSQYVGICRACADMLSGVSSKEVVRIDNAVDPKRLCEPVRDTEFVQRVRLLAVGRLQEEKNFELLLRAIHLIPSDLVCLEIAGEGRQRQLLERVISELHIGDRVTLLGNVRDVAARLARSDVFVMSSQREGLPIALIEATLMGVPSVVTNVGGCAELLHETGSGLIVDDPTPRAYARMLQRVVLDHELRESLARNARMYSERYNLQTALDGHVAVYRGLVEKRS